MKFLVDSDLPPELCAYLRAAGHDALHLDAVLAEKAYRSVIAAAAEQSRVVISRDTTLAMEREANPAANVSLVLLQHAPRDPDALGRALCAALTPSVQSLIIQAGITYLHRNGITATNISL